MLHIEKDQSNIRKQIVVQKQTLLISVITSITINKIIEELRVSGWLKVSKYAGGRYLSAG